jgi:hypothetical protein
MMRTGDSDCGPEGRDEFLGHPAPLLRAWNVVRSVGNSTPGALAVPSEASGTWRLFITHQPETTRVSRQAVPSLVSDQPWKFVGR